MLTDHMLFLTYTPRDDSERRGYEPWLRSTDTPFFNSVPGIAHYSNWKLVPGKNGLSVDWGYFDFLHIANGKTIDDIWGNERLGAFATDWNVMWGKEPDNEDLSVNYQIHEAKRIQAMDAARTDFLALILSPDRSKLPGGAEIWSVTKPILGQSVEGEFAFLNLAVDKTKVDPAWGKTVLLAECIAKPDKFVTI